MQALECTVSHQGAEISRLGRLIDQKDKIIRELKFRLSKYEEPPKDSHNSSVPPSQNPIDKKVSLRTQSLRKPSGKPSGGQPGHKGHFLETSAHPNLIIDHQPEFCQCCGMTLNNIAAKVMETAQIIEIPPVVPVVTEHISYGKRCTCGHLNVCELPKVCRGRISYGPMVQSLVGYLGHVQSISFNRICETLRDVFALSISEGTVRNMLKRLGTLSTDAYEEIRKRVESSSVVGGDETGTFVGGNLHWGWVFQTPLLTYAFQDSSRGIAAVEKHYPNHFPKSVMVSDRHGTYFKLKVKEHQVCIPHILRNTTYLSELDTGQTWSKRLIELLQEAIHYRKEVSDVTQSAIQEYAQRLDGLLSENLDALHEDFNKLRKGLIKVQQYIFTFLTNSKVPNDNNASERAIRKIKVKQKVSGGFRTEDGADIFMKIHSLAETAKKNGNSKFNVLLAVAKQ
ncbi:MAG: IS66 family transposase [Tannerellaceae bacterium]|nr:IS66 family transposase [Tannerellaceae bacterium]